MFGLTYRLWRHTKNWFFRGRLPTGGMEGTAGVADLQSVYLHKWEEGDLIFGRVHDFDLPATAGIPFWLGHKTEHHVWLMGSTRSEKGTSVIMPNLLRTKGSFVMVDPKGEGWQIAAESLKQRGYKVFLLDPMRECAKALGVPATGDEVGFNPLFGINEFDLNAPRLINELADILIEMPDNVQSGSKYWIEVARALVAGLMAYSMCFHRPSAQDVMQRAEMKGRAKAAAEDRAPTPEDFDYSDEDRRHVFALRNIISYVARFHTLNDEDRVKILNSMMALRKTLKDARQPMPALLDVIENGASQGLAQLGEKAYNEGRTTLLSTLSTAFRWADGPIIRSELRGLDFKLKMSMLKQEQKIAVFIVMPETALKTHGAWIKMVLTSAINASSQIPWEKEAIVKRPNGKLTPIDVWIDEAPQLGFMECIERAFSVGAGRGLRVILISQNMAQIKKIYGQETMESIVSASVQVLCGGGDNFTGQYFATKAGRTYQRDEKTGERSDDKVPVWGPDEVWKVVHEAQRCLTIWPNGLGPTMVRKVNYFDDDSELQAGVDYAMHPEHQELVDTLWSPDVVPTMISTPRGTPRNLEGGEDDVIQHIMLGAMAAEERHLIEDRS